MKKLGLIMIFLLVGCSKNYVVCSSHIDNKKENYSSDINYTIYHKNSRVTKVIIDEKYTSDDENKIEYFDNYLKLTYVTLDEQYGGYSYEKKDIKNGINYITTIDYSKVDVKKMKTDNYIDKNYIVNNKVTLSGLEKVYEEKGASCK